MVKGQQPHGEEKNCCCLIFFYSIERFYLLACNSCFLQVLALPQWLVVDEEGKWFPLLNSSQ